ncbi:hypothetical protein E4U24_002732 [Claviceps purpurea]|nr:hypothetical protein E4U24_002732 [Claviceps purpurea]
MVNIGKSRYCIHTPRQDVILLVTMQHKDMVKAQGISHESLHLSYAFPLRQIHRLPSHDLIPSIQGASV